MTKVVVAMSMSLDGMAGPKSADADGMAIFTAILGWQFPLRSWRQEQGMDGGEDSVDSRVWADNFARFGPQVIGRTGERTRRFTLPSSSRPTVTASGSRRTAAPATRS